MVQHQNNKRMNDSLNMKTIQHSMIRTKNNIITTLSVMQWTKYAPHMYTYIYIYIYGTYTSLNI